MLFVLLKESVLFAWQSLVSNKLRSFLSLLGITIGIFAIILVFTIVDGLESNIRGSVESLGNNVVYVQKWPWSFGPDYPWWKYINRPTPQYYELDELQRRCKTTEAVAYRIGARKTIKYRSNSIKNAVVAGISHDFYKIKNFDLSSGRYFTQNETEAGYRLVLIGAEIAAGLFGDEDPIGKQIKISGHKSTVIGVIKKEGESLLGMSFDYQVVTPYNFARYIMDVRSERSDPTIYVKAKPNVSNAEMMDELTGVLRGLRKIKPIADQNFALNETSLLSKAFDALFDIIGTAGWIIGGFSILVGGFGIANIMFVSVRERTNLIGIQKSLGAKNIFILFQFLSESVLLSFIGGFFGLLLTFIITELGKDAMGMDISLSSANIILGFTISILIGIISGFIPAYSASQLDPVEAIRTN
ncbi:ABC transporter permease [Aurantibacillus circumpalustris]|uniref:ABC transporter permease n=1 Tax=Aurantibacillus circumpalustris TaxID=3036359 RepID=UPI00295ACC1F|nr:ABC transporter permease [Aurantibacillus circumpalustris]